MPENKRRKVDTDNNGIFRLLNHFDPFDLDGLDSNAIIKSLKQNPQSAAVKYRFDDRFGFLCYPLHQATSLGANINVVKSIYESYPRAIQEQDDGGDTALFSSIKNGAPTEVVKFLLSKWPEAVRQKDSFGNTILHVACMNDISSEILISFLNIWPDAAKEKNGNGATPLHMALLRSNPSSLIVSLLLKHNLDALKVRDIQGRIPLLCAVHQLHAPLDLILVLLERWPKAIIEKDAEGKTPYDMHDELKRQREKIPHQLRSRKDTGEGLLQKEKIHRLLCLVHQLYSSDKLNSSELKEMIGSFVEIEWWNGIVIILDQYPISVKDLDISLKVFPKLLSLVSKRCKMKTMWEVMRNELDIMEGV